MRYLQPTRLGCFSPPVMIATFAIEIALAIWVTWRYKMSAVTRVSAGILCCLALFQLAEYNVCEGSFGLDGQAWSRLGFVAITALPPLGIHLASRLAHRKDFTLLTAAYGSGIAFAAYFMFSSFGAQESVCAGNYVIFHISPQMALLYGAYYYGWLAVGVIYATTQAQRSKKPNVSAALTWLMRGYLLFMIPTIVVNFLDPATLGAIPSIMCGFAVALALIVAGFVLPCYFRQPIIVPSIPLFGIIARRRAKTDD